MLFGFADELFEIRPDVRTMAPVSRERMSVLCTPGFWLSRVSNARVSSVWRQSASYMSMQIRHVLSVEPFLAAMTVQLR